VVASTSRCRASWRHHVAASYPAFGLGPVYEPAVDPDRLKMPVQGAAVPVTQWVWISGQVRYHGPWSG
jgi:hypothetical protein